MSRRPGAATIAATDQRPPEGIVMTTSPAPTTTVDNAATVAAIYDAFGHGDVGAILERLADGVAWDEWPDNFAQRAGVPHLVRRRGRNDVAGFFGVIGAWTVLDFAVLDVIGTGRQVAAEVRASFALPGGARFADEELHLWTFGEDGRVVRFRHYCDTAKHIAVSEGRDTMAG
jgi:ketosteroid isomerase-like protein